MACGRSAFCGRRGVGVVTGDQAKVAASGIIAISILTGNPIVIAGFTVSVHALQRMLEREVDADHIIATIVSPDHRRIQVDGMERCSSDLCTVVLDRVSRTIVTVFEGSVNALHPA